MKKNEHILNSVIDECKRHAKRMNFAYQKLSKLIPLTKEHLLEFKEEEVALIDQLIYRFTKLQDAIGQKLFKNVLAILDEDTANKSAIDIFNRLEQLEIIKDYDTWKDLRDLRNELAHEYEEDEGSLTEELNMLFRKKFALEKYLEDIIQFLNGRGFKF
ncbi:MAG: hypothetical protein M1480_21525 [Bacteroidetes bacterium]|nr:hypothetical protein [Bacteroidota bacterium]